MIQPFSATEENHQLPREYVNYKIVAWGDTLPSFDPLLMVKTLVLSPSSVKRFNRVARKWARVTEQTVLAGLVLRFVVFAIPAHLSRIIAPISAILHLPGMFVFFAGFRIEYIKIILRTFDFWFLYVASAIWAVVFSIVLQDTRALLVIVCWANFINALLQETYLRNTNFILIIVLWEWVFYALLMVWLSLEFVDEVSHYVLISSRNRTFSTKDILVNALATLVMLLVRNTYGRFTQAIRQKEGPGLRMRTLGYKCKIALSVSCCQGIILPQPTTDHSNGLSSTKLASNVNGKHLPLQMHLIAESARFDPRKTVWTCLGALTPLARWKIVVLYIFAALGVTFAALSVFLPRNSPVTKAIAVSGLVMSMFVSGVSLSCCQKQLLKRVLVSFQFVFFAFQVIATAFCVMDICSWQWVSVCGVVNRLLLEFTVLTVDALTPIMKKRLHLKYWIPVTAIIVFRVIEIVLLVDVMVLDTWSLQDRVFLDFVVLGHRSQFHVAPFLSSRVVTLIVWTGRYVYVALTREDDNALILLRGEVEFDYGSWRKQLRQTTYKQ